mgnify:CR=1 FL=1
MLADSACDAGSEEPPAKVILSITLRKVKGYCYAQEHLETSRIGGYTMKKYVVIYEWTGKNYSAYVPDLPGCIACGDTLEETEKLMHEAISLYRSMRQNPKISSGRNQ